MLQFWSNAPQRKDIFIRPKTKDNYKKGYISLMILVTGGTGLVGSHLLYKLTQTEENVRAIYRSEKKIDLVKHVFSYFTNDIEPLFLKIEWVKGDILNVPSLEEHFAGITKVYHCAALVSFDPNDYSKLRKINIEGTANIVNLCIANKVSKLCYTSSIAAIGDEKPGTEINEDSPWNSEANHSVYAITKYGAEMEVWRGTQEGLKSVIVNPGIIIGAGFWKSGSGSLFKKIYKGINYFTLGKTGYVDIQDVVNNMVKLMNSSVVNEGFILVSDNWSFKQFIQTVAKKLNVKPPEKEAKSWLLNLGWKLDWLKSLINGKRRRLTKQMVNSLQSESMYSNVKIRQALNTEFKPLETSIEEVSRCFLKEF